MVSHDRWKAAQDYERSFWQGVAESVADDASARLGFYEWRADTLVEKLRELGLDSVVDGTACVIEVGSGPVGISGFLPAARRVAVDPLEDHYKKDPRLVALRNPEVDYRMGMGESLPVEDNAFDLAIIENCIDHVQDVSAVLNELQRVLRPGGGLYLTVNCRSRPGYVVHRILSSLALDPGHPHTFTAKRAVRVVSAHGFEVIGSESGSFYRSWIADLRGPSKRARLKAVLGVSEFVTSVYARTAA